VTLTVRNDPIHGLRALSASTRKRPAAVRRSEKILLSVAGSEGPRLCSKQGGGKSDFADRDDTQGQASENLYAGRVIYGDAAIQAIRKEKNQTRNNWSEHGENFTRCPRSPGEFNRSTQHYSLEQSSRGAGAIPP
jgi:hypothetical protein